MTETFLDAALLVPFPTYDFLMKQDIEHNIQRLSSICEVPSLSWLLKFPSNFASNCFGFEVHCLFFQTDHALEEPRHDSSTIVNKIPMFLRPPLPHNPSASSVVQV